jgi:hypothetical protein
MKKRVVILIIVFALCFLLLVMPSAAANVTATVSPSAVAPGNKIFINGTVDGQPNSVAIWVLGKNFAFRQTVAVNLDGTFTFEINQYTTKLLYSGQYFVVVQHPMMNGVYDIDICSGNPQYVCDYSGTTPASIFKISGLGSLQDFDAEEALVQGINQPYIDDTYTALQFQIVSLPVTATISPSTVAKGEKTFINGTAEGQPSSVAIWILGQNFAFRQTQIVNLDGTFSYEVSPGVTNSLSSGQYFVVVQHPMMNGVYDIDICSGNPQYVCDFAVGQPYGGPSGITGPVSVFKINGPGSLQGSDAAEALVTAINQPYIDDTYTSLQFQIVSPSSIGIFRPASGYWYFDYNLDGIVDKSFRYGGSTDRIITGDWDGDGKDGIAIFRPSSGFWYFDYNLDGIVDKSFRYGGVGDQIAKGDWNGDGSDGIAIFRPSTGYWYFDYNLDGIVDKSFRYGGSTDQILGGKWT